MDAARAAVSKITQRTGHRTEVDEVVNPAVTAEVIKPHVHEETQEAIDREVHQHHYHTTVQPIAHREVLPEKHIHNVAPQIEREFRHDNERDTAAKVEAELGQFRNTQTVTQQTRSTAVAAAVAGEHVHHHVHETVQPVIHKEVIQPEVHTVIPIHEVHHASSEYHGISALPMKTLDEFSAAGGLVTGTKSHTHEEYDGAPRPYNEKLMTTLEKVLPTHHHQQGTTGLTGTTGSSGYSDTAGLTGSGLSGTGQHHQHHLGRDAAIGAGVAGTAGGLEHEHHKHDREGHHSLRNDEQNLRGDYDNLEGRGTGVGNSSRSGNSKPSLMDKLNPNVDSNGDGKAGFMK